MTRSPHREARRRPIARRPRLLACIALLAIAFGVGDALARGFREIQPIASPNAKLAMPKGSIPVENPEPIPRETVEAKLRQIIERWNSPRMEQTLADGFYDKRRLLNAVDAQVPRDARLRLQSIQSVRTVQQYRSAPSEYGPQKTTTIVSAVAQTQLEFNSPRGFVRLPGVNEFILRITDLEQP